MMKPDEVSGQGLELSRSGSWWRPIVLELGGEVALGEPRAALSLGGDLHTTAFGADDAKGPLPRGFDAETSLGRHELGEEWKPLSQILTALRVHDGRTENEVQDLVEIAWLSQEPFMHKASPVED